jgi:hypothetical protein
MGLAHIMVVRDDVIRNAEVSEEKQLETAVGAAVVQLCLDPAYEETAEGHVRITDAAVLNHSNGISCVGEVGSSDVRVFAWIGNCLRPIADLPQEDLDLIKNIVERQKPPISR